MTIVHSFLVTHTGYLFLNYFWLLSFFYINLIFIFMNFRPRGWCRFCGISLMPTFSNKVCCYFVSFTVTANLFVIISFILLLSSCIFNFPPISYVLCEELDFKKIIKNNNNNNNSKFKNKVRLLKTIKFFKSQWTDLSHITENKKFKLVTNNFFNKKKELDLNLI